MPRGSHGRLGRGVWPSWTGSSAYARWEPRRGVRMECAACGTANDADSRFCTECGAPLAQVCPSCSTPYKPGSKFCGGCGAALAGAPAAAAETAPSAGPALAPGAQRRVVSVLFADLVGFTTISQHRDAEEVRELLTRYFDTARVAVERHGGLVEKFIGDAVMAVWGSETAHEDDAERAVRAGLELVEAVRSLGSDVGVDLFARAGVLTGEAAVTVGATDQGMVAGDLVNTASRLQSAAEAGTVLVGEETYRAACEAITFESRGEIDVKGRDEPVSIWQALQVVGNRGGSGRPGRPEPPFAGRAEELRLVKELLHVTARERRARLVSITGIGGIGKSRMVWEFEKYIDGLSDDGFWHQGRCPAYGEGVTFWALGEMVRMRAGIAETDDAGDARRTLAEMLDRHLHDDERAWAEPRFAYLLGLDDAPPGNPEELFSAWRTLFERIAETGVTTLVFEDVHWADAGLLDFIESLLEWSRNSAILVITLSRPELLDRRPTWGAGQRNFTALHLEPLDPAPMTALVNGFVNGLPATDAERIVARAEGVPLYAVETIRMLADSGVLEVAGSRYSVVGDIGALEVPGTLHALIAARLDVLPAADRELLRDAAVLGTSFTPRSLAAIRGDTVETLDPRLRSLVRKEFLVQDTDPRSPERGQYAFLQGLIREVAYGTLSKADRRRKHLSVASHFETLDEDELAGVVASHYLEALRATPEGPDADELAVTVRERVRTAATRALSLGSPDQALTFVEQALELTPETERAQLWQLAGDAAHRAGHYERAADYLNAAASAYAASGDGVQLARVASALLRPLTMADRRAEALAMLETARAQLPDDADDRTRAELFMRLSEIMQQHGRSELALEYIEVALPAAERLGSLDLVTEAISNKSTVLFTLGRHREALVLSRGAVDAATESGSHSDQAIAFLNLCIQLAEVSPRGTYDACLAAATAARRAGIRGLEQIAQANAIEAAVDVGEFDDASRLLEELLPTSEGFQGAGLALSAAVLAAYRGEADEAKATLAALDARMSLEGRMVAERSWHLRASSLVRLLSGDVVGAYDEGMQAVSLEPTGMNAPNALAGCSHAAACLREPAKLRDTIAAMELLPGRWLQRQLRGARAALDALDSRVDDAVAAYQQLFEEWLHDDLPLDHAWCVAEPFPARPGTPAAP